MATLPSGTVTLLFTDIEGSTPMWEQQPEATRVAVESHARELSALVERFGGQVFKSIGDGHCAAFPSIREALLVALEAQRALAGVQVGTTPLRVRMALHTGLLEPSGGDYLGPPVNRVARLLGLGHGGQVLLSGAAAELAADCLPGGAALQSLGTHRLRGLSRAEHVHQLLHPELAATFPPLKSDDEHPTNLPQQLNSFIGRQRELAEVTRLLEAHRHVTLTGMGGTGKTRLAMEVAAGLPHRFPDGIWLVELAPLNRPEQVPGAVAAAARLREVPGEPLEATLARELAPRRVLLLLDNCEHLVAACASLAAELLRAGGGLHLLATSREPLGIPGEHEWAVPCLALPEPPEDSPQTLATDSLPAGVLRSEAVRLFADRAGQVRPGFSLTPHNAAAVSRICRRLDGLPLAIELAAARVRVLSPEQIDLRLDDRFALLRGGPRTLAPRQQTLKALIDWSYELLTPAEAALLRRLSVFAGGFTLTAAEAVCPDEEDPLLPRTELLELLTRLVERSLVYSEDPAEDAVEPRYRLLETVRQYARERLHDECEESRLRERHLAYYRAEVRLASGRMEGATRGDALHWLDAERDNISAALETACCVGSEAHAGLDLCGHMWKYWYTRGRLREGRGCIAGMLALPGARRFTAEWAKARYGEAALAYAQHDLAAAETGMREALAVRRELGEPLGIAEALNGLGESLRSAGHATEARRCLEEALALLREARAAGVNGATWLYLLATNNLGNVLYSLGELAAAAERYQEVLRHAEAHGDAHTAALARGNLGLVARDREDLDLAEECHRAQLAWFTSLGDATGIRHARMHLGILEHWRGRLESAEEHYRAAIASARDSGDLGGLVDGLTGLGMIDALRGRPTAGEHLKEALRACRGLMDPRTVAAALTGVAEVFRGLGYLAEAARMRGAAEAAAQRGELSEVPYEARRAADLKAKLAAALGAEQLRDLLLAGAELAEEDALRHALAVLEQEQGAGSLSIRPADPSAELSGGPT